MTDGVFSVDADVFDDEVVQRSHTQPVVVLFGAAWCASCRGLEAVLEPLAVSGAPDWRMVKVDTDDGAELADRFGVQGIPAVRAFRDGEVVGSFVGAQRSTWVEKWLRDTVPSEADRLADVGSEADLRRALELRPGHPLASAKLAALLVDIDPSAAEALLTADLQGDALALARRVRRRLEAGTADLASLRAACEASRDDVATWWRLAHGLAAVEDLDGALGALLEIVKRDRTYREDGARRMMLRLLDELGPRDPVVLRRRRELGEALAAL